jgi:hypothetical protein
VPRDNLRAAQATVLAWTVAVAAAIALLLAADHRAGSVLLDADGWRDRPFLLDFGPFHPDGFRLASARSEARLPGLWPRAPVDVSVAVASALPKAQDVEVWANGAIAHRSDVGGQYGVLRFTAWTDAAGTLSLRLVAPRARAPEALRLTWMRVDRAGRGPWPWSRVPLYGATLALVLVAAAWLEASARSRGVALGLAVAALAAGLWCSRLLVLAWLPRLTACAAGGLLLAVLAAAVLPFPRKLAAWWGVVLAFRFFLLPLADLGSIDLTFHAHNIERFQRGEILGSAVSDAAGQAVFIPYPPALYAALAPFVAVGDTATAETLVRWAMIALEGSVPLLVLAIALSAGAGARAAALAAVAAAVMPEGLLVVPKGIAANVTGAWLALGVVWAVVARAAPVIVAGAAALAFLGHPGSAAALAGLLAVWALFAARGGEEPARRVAWVAAAVAAGALVAWALYYREVAALTRDSLGHFGEEGRRIAGRFTSVRWVHLGKMVQDLALKFGLGPFALAIAGLVSVLPARLRPLLHAWLLVTAGLAGFALLTPIALRFEYFVAPALAMAAGIGAERLIAAGRRALVYASFAVSLAIQVGLGLWLHSGAFDPINVIIPSPRWPLVL